MASPEARNARATIALIAVVLALSVSLVAAPAVPAAQVPHPSPGAPVSPSAGTEALSGAALTSAALPADESSWLVPMIAGGLLAALLTTVWLSSRVRRSSAETDAVIAPILHRKGTREVDDRGRRAA